MPNLGQKMWKLYLYIMNDVAYNGLTLVFRMIIFNFNINIFIFVLQIANA